MQVEYRVVREGEVVASLPLTTTGNQVRQETNQDSTIDGGCELART